MVEEAVAIALARTFKKNGEVDAFSQFIEEIYFIWGRVIEKPKNFHANGIINEKTTFFYNECI